MSNMADGLNMQPRIGEPETSFPASAQPVGGPVAFLAPNMPDTSGPGPTPLQQPGTWSYDFNPADGVARATFNGEVIPSGGGPGAGVSTFNTRTGDVTLALADVTAAGGAPIASPIFTGTPAAPTRLAGDSSGAIATTAFVQQAVVAGAGVSTFNGRNGAVTLTSADIMAAGGAPLSSPALTGTPTAPTASLGDVSNQIATDAFVSNAIAGGTVTTWNGRRGAVSLTLSDVLSVGGAPIASPTFTGTPAGTTAPPGDATTRLATTAFVTAAVTGGTAGVASVNTRTGAVVLNAADLTAMGGAPINSPTFTGTPHAPTPSGGDNSTAIATTAFVDTAIASLPVGVATWNGRTGTVTLALSDVTSVGGAPIASPTFTGSPAAPTPPALDNSTRLATTAFVDAAIAAIPAGPAPSNALPSMNGTASAGVDAAYSRDDHVHPTDTSRASVAALAGYLSLGGGTLTGALNGTTVNASGSVTVTGNIQWGGTLTNPATAATLIVGHGGAPGVINNVAGFTITPLTGAVFENTSNPAIYMNRNSGNGTAMSILQSAVACGSISVANGNSTTFSTTSDGRLKTDRQPIDSGPLLDALEVWDFEWIMPEGSAFAAAGPVRGQGVIAQDAIEVFPDAIHHDEDADTWGADYSKFVPMLIAEVKALRARVASLEGTGFADPVTGLVR